MSISESEIVLERSEVDAMDEAVNEVGGLLKDQKSLDMIEQHKYRMNRKKQMVEMSLKNAVETQLNGVRSGLLILQTVLQDADDICQNMRHVNQTYAKLAGDLSENISELQETRVIHKEHSLLNNYLQNIYSFKDDIVSTCTLLDNEELLKAHEIFMKLEDCRNGIYKELSLDTLNSHHQEKVKDFFSGLREVNVLFEKKIKYYTDTAISAIKTCKTTKLVSILRIIEREERRDDMYSNISSLEDRPKKWKEKALESIKNSISNTFEGIWEGYKENEKEGWVLKFVEKIKTNTESSLNAVYIHLQYCFPPSWNILNFYCQQYRDNTHARFIEIINKIKEKNGDANSYIIVFDWSTKLNKIIHKFKSEESGRNDILTPDNINSLVKYYNDQLTVELAAQTERILEQECNDRYDVSKYPEQDVNDDKYYTSTPVIFYQMIHQNMDFAFKLDNQMEILSVLDQLASKITFFADTYTKHLLEFKERYFNLEQEDRDEMPFVEWMIAACNNALQCSKLSDELIEKIVVNQGEKIGSNFRNKSELFIITILEGACSHITELVLSELKSSVFTMLLTPAWRNNKGWLTCKLTIEDWDRSYFHLIDPKGRQKLLEIIAQRFLTEYLVILFNTKSLTMSTEEFRVQLSDDHDEIMRFFGSDLRLDSFEQIKNDYDALPIIGDLVGEDDALLEMNMAKITRTYKDVRYDQCVALLALRGDKNHKDIKDIILRHNVQEELVDVPKKQKTIFSKVNAVTGPLSSRFFQTVVTSRTRSAVNTSITNVTNTTPLSKIKENMSNAISNSPVYHAINNAFDKEQLAERAVRALDFSSSDNVQPERTNPFEDPRDSKGPAPKPPGKKKGAAPIPPSTAKNSTPIRGSSTFETNKSTNPFDDDDDFL